VSPSAVLLSQAKVVGGVITLVAQSMLGRNKLHAISYCMGTILITLAYSALRQCKQPSQTNHRNRAPAARHDSTATRSEAFRAPTKLKRPPRAALHFHLCTSVSEHKLPGAERSKFVFPGWAQLPAALTLPRSDVVNP
jgi:hypothetical protein